MSVVGGDIIALLTGGLLETPDSEAPPVSSTPPTLSNNPTRLDKRLLPKVLKLINKYGKEVIFRDDPDGTYDPTTGKYTAGTVLYHDRRIIPPFPFDEKYINGDTIRVGDILTGVAASGIPFTPYEGMKVDISSVIWRIIKTGSVYTGQNIALFMLQLRK